MAVAALSEWLVFVHVLAAMVWVGGLAAFAAFAFHALRTDDPGTVARFVGSLRLVGPMVLTPSSIMVLLVGTWLVLDGDGFSFGQTWIWLALVLLAVAVLVGVLYLARMAQGAERAVAAGDHQQARIQLRRWSLGIRLILLLLVVATWDMIFKPGL
jgi:uncharacterized membrane protein